MKNSSEIEDCLRRADGLGGALSHLAEFAVFLAGHNDGSIDGLLYANDSPWPTTRSTIAYAIRDAVADALLRCAERAEATRLREPTSEARNALSELGVLFRGQEAWLRAQTIIRAPAK